jgi:hypothetical protein
MPKRTVLAIGIEPSFVDFSAFPHLTPELSVPQEAPWPDRSPAKLRRPGASHEQDGMIAAGTREQIRRAIGRSPLRDVSMS